MCRPSKKSKKAGGDSAASGAMVQLSRLARLDTCVTVIDAANFLPNFQYVARSLCMSKRLYVCVCVCDRERKERERAIVFVWVCMGVWA